MARFIDADALQLEPDPWGGMNGVLFLGRNGGKTMAMVQSALKRMIDDAPTIDAVPVVRCKDCEYSRPTQWYSAMLKCCHKSHGSSQVPYEVPPEHFCSYGERRTGL